MISPAAPPRQPDTSRTLPAWAVAVAAAGMIALLAGLCAARWQPGQGLTALIQFDAHFASQALPELRAMPHYIRTRGGYDGQFYAQVALDPTLRQPGMQQALDAPERRARRILLPAIGYVAGLGQPTWIIQVFPFLNLGVWLGLMAMLLCRPQARTVHGLLAAAAILLSVGALESVRLSLTDLLAATLLLVAAWQAEASGVCGVLASLSLLARETSILALPALFWPMPTRFRTLVTCGLLAALAALPWLAWACYVHYQLGGQHLQAWSDRESEWMFPGTGMIGRAGRAVDILRHHFSLQECFVLATVVSLPVQFAYLAVRPRWQSALWRLGIVFGGLFICLGPKVWDGHAAVCRVVLPMTMAFNLLLAEEQDRKKFLRWFVAGNVFSLWGVIKFATFDL